MSGCQGKGEVGNRVLLFPGYKVSIFKMKRAMEMVVMIVQHEYICALKNGSD